ncbi:unnamed protein product [Prorocentrum cordatum]|uniref:Pentacotripeptide-repeat region of PRORP domain-containing protein n=1 Tax=Prorocentrum cordatum TaxID=2364126 RepID=A0ABN9XJD4_9DINO|nr:unnamed protein product [Polarella glacialis]
MLQSLVEDVESTWRSQHGTIACAVPAVLILFVLGDPVAAALRGMRATGLQNEFMILTALALAYSVGMTTAGERARSASKARAVAPSKVLPERCQAKRPVQSMARLSSQVPRASAPVLKTHSDAGRSVQQTSGARSLSHSARLDPEGADTDVLERAKSEGVAPNAQAWSLVVGACVRLENSGVALELLEQMLAQGAHHEAELRNSSTVGKFFRLVVEHLDEQRMREIGVQLLDVIQAHGLAPTAIVQNRLICAWKSKPPDEVLRALVGLRDRGVRLTPTAYRCIMFANERARPEFTLQLYEEMVERGVKFDRVSFNAALCACAVLGLTGKALELFDRMQEHGPSGARQTRGMAAIDDSIRQTDATAARPLQLEPELATATTQMPTLEQKMETEYEECMTAVNALKEDWATRDGLPDDMTLTNADDVIDLIKAGSTAVLQLDVFFYQHDLHTINTGVTPPEYNDTFLALLPKGAPEADPREAGVPPCQNTFVYLSRACQKRGWTEIASQIDRDGVDGRSTEASSSSSALSSTSA